VERKSKYVKKNFIKYMVSKGVDEILTVGTVIIKSEVEKNQIQIEYAISKGAVAVTTEMKLSEEEKINVNFIQPTILNNVSKDMKIFTEETFGPVAPIITFTKENELLSLANHENYGLAAYMY